ncbi:MAG: glycosyltransferase family 4 protein [Gemmatimonadetes bacterium]|nr:glycosyltransferase family 4 protein [Gemmatimonadota bacterium]
MTDPERTSLRVGIVASRRDVAQSADDPAVSALTAWLTRLRSAPGVRVRLSLKGGGSGTGEVSAGRDDAPDGGAVATGSLFAAVRGSDVVHVFYDARHVSLSYVARALGLARIFGKRTILQLCDHEGARRVTRTDRAAARVRRRADRIVVSSPGLGASVARPERAVEVDGPDVYEDVLFHPLRVCMVAPTTRILGGQAVQAERLRRRLEETPDVDVRLLPVNPELPGPFGWLQKIKFVRTLVTEARYVWTLWPALRDCDIAHIFSASYFSFVLAPTPALVVARALGKRSALNYRSGEADDHLTRWKRTAVPTIALADRVVVGSGYLIDVFARHGFDAEAIPNIVEVDRYTYRVREELRPIFLANRNFEVHYNVGHVLRAFAIVQGEHPSARLLVAGDGPERSALEALRDELSLDGVEFLGQVPPDEMPGLYDRADLYINASLIDNLPTSLIEAFAAGTPVVTYASGGVPKLVDHERTGLMVEPDAYEALGEAALRLLRDPALAGRIAAEARAECLSRYTREAVLEGWLDAYRRLLLGVRAGRPSDARPHGPESTPALGYVE